jgi:tRNA-specific 2-thiouridylase
MIASSAPQDAGMVIVGLSGGVDSAVAALLLIRAGYAVQGLFMSNWDDDDAYCTAAEDFQDARRVADLLGIALHRVSFAAEYKERVFGHFLREYAAGRTPNPDVLCNREIKFGVCLNYMERLGGSLIATGHYARVRRNGTHTALLKAVDGAKDQSYFLHQVSSRALDRTLFPLGELHKDEVRGLAHAAGLPVFDKPDSTGICFIGERPFEQFLSGYLRQPAGPIEDVDGRVLGEHRGLALYTLGQRSGLRIGGRAGAANAPWYAADKDAARNALIVVQERDHPLLMSNRFEVTDLAWLEAGLLSRGRFSCTVKTRYRQEDLRCEVSGHDDPAAGDSLGGATVSVALAAPARAVTPGQYAVFYDGETCLGGGVIARRFSEVRSTTIAYNSVFSAEGS